MFRCIQGRLSADYPQWYWNSRACQHWPPGNQRFVYMLICIPFTTSQSKHHFCPGSNPLLTQQFGQLSPQVCWSGLVQMPDVDYSCMTCSCECRWLSCHLSWICHGWDTHLFSLNRFPQQCMMLWLGQLTVIFSQPLWQIRSVFIFFCELYQTCQLSALYMRLKVTFLFLALEMYNMNISNVSVKIHMRWCKDVRSGLESMNNEVYSPSLQNTFQTKDGSPKCFDLIMYVSLSIFKFYPWSCFQNPLEDLLSFYKIFHALCWFKHPFM